MAVAAAGARLRAHQSDVKVVNNTHTDTHPYSHKHAHTTLHPLFGVLVFELGHMDN